VTSGPAVRIQASPLASATAAATGLVGWPASWPPRWRGHIERAADGLDLDPLRAALPRDRPLAVELLGTGDGVQQELAAIGGRERAALARLWERAVAPLWPAVEPLLERELLRLGALLVTDGPAAVLPVPFDGRGVRIAPVLCAPDHQLLAESETEVVVAPALTDAAHLWADAAPGPADALARLLGHTRARVLLATVAPGTTLDVAEQLAISPALASHHLIELRRQGLVDGARFGRRVFYRLTARGRRLRDACAVTP
jgi:DNA-binding transcriptional ArsR family regulator